MWFKVVCISKRTPRKSKLGDCLLTTQKQNIFFNILHELSGEKMLTLFYCFWCCNQYYGSTYYLIYRVGVVWGFFKLIVEGEDEFLWVPLAKWYRLSKCVLNAPAKYSFSNRTDEKTEIFFWRSLSRYVRNQMHLICNCIFSSGTMALYWFQLVILVVAEMQLCWRWVAPGSSTAIREQLTHALC